MININDIVVTNKWDTLEVIYTYDIGNGSEIVIAEKQSTDVDPIKRKEQILFAFEKALQSSVI